MAAARQIVIVSSVSKTDSKIQKSVNLVLRLSRTNAIVNSE